MISAKEAREQYEGVQQREIEKTKLQQKKWADNFPKLQEIAKKSVIPEVLKDIEHHIKTFSNLRYNSVKYSFRMEDPTFSILSSVELDNYNPQTRTKTWYCKKLDDFICIDHILPMIMKELQDAGYKIEYCPFTNNLRIEW